MSVQHLKSKKSLISVLVVQNMNKHVRIIVFHIVYYQCTKRNANKTRLQFYDIETFCIFALLEER